SRPLCPEVVQSPDERRQGVVPCLHNETLIKGLLISAVGPRIDKNLSPEGEVLGIDLIVPVIVGPWRVTWIALFAPESVENDLAVVPVDLEIAVEISWHGKIQCHIDARRRQDRVFGIERAELDRRCPILQMHDGTIV